MLGLSESVADESNDNGLVHIRGVDGCSMALQATEVQECFRLLG